MNKTKLMRYPVLITIIGSVLMLLMLFLPFASATEDYKEKLLKYEDEMYVEEIGMTNGEAVNISLYEFGKMYVEAANQGMHKEISIACIVIISLFAGFSILTLLLSLFKKSMGIIIFDLLAIGTFKIICFDFEDRGVLPSSSFDWGIVSWMVYVIGMLVFAGAIWLFVEKRKAKKIAKVEQVADVQE